MFPFDSTLKSTSSESSLIVTAPSAIVSWSSLEDDWSSIPAYVVPPEPHDKVPEPSVKRALPFDPSATGKT